MINTFSNLIEERNSIKKIQLWVCESEQIRVWGGGERERDSLYSVATISSLYDAEWFVEKLLTINTLFLCISCTNLMYLNKDRYSWFLSAPDNILEFLDFCFTCARTCTHTQRGIHIQVFMGLDKGENCCSLDLSYVNLFLHWIPSSAISILSEKSLPLERSGSSPGQLLGHLEYISHYHCY